MTTSSGKPAWRFQLPDVAAGSELCPQRAFQNRKYRALPRLYSAFSSSLEFRRAVVQYLKRLQASSSDFKRTPSHGRRTASAAPADYDFTNLRVKLRSRVEARAYANATPWMQALAQTIVGRLYSNDNSFEYHSNLSMTASFLPLRSPLQHTVISSCDEAMTWLARTVAIILSSHHKRMCSGPGQNLRALPSPGWCWGGWSRKSGRAKATSTRRRPRSHTTGSHTSSLWHQPWRLVHDLQPAGCRAGRESWRGPLAPFHAAWFVVRGGCAPLVAFFSALLLHRLSLRYLPSATCSSTSILTGVRVTLPNHPNKPPHISGLVANCRFRFLGPATAPAVSAPPLVSDPSLAHRTLQTLVTFATINRIS